MEGRYSINAYNGLVALGHSVTVNPDFDAYFGGSTRAVRHPAKRLHGGADPRRDGQAARTSLGGTDCEDSFRDCRRASSPVRQAAARPTP